ncbi:c-type cytochrome domain-containing protein [Stratiformator vulcanicus]|nr:c-type cytochrome domain-containing protein [Stratiformator vulcanicus]
MPLRTLFVVSPILCGAIALAEDGAAPDFNTEVAPILTKYCAGCHGDFAPDGDFALHSYDALLKGTPDGPAVLAGDAESSLIVRLITGEAEPAMPPDDEPKPGENEIAILTRWIDGGAKGPAGVEPDRLSLIVPKIEGKADIRPITAVDIAPDGGLLAVARFGTVAIYNASEFGSAMESDPVVELDEFPGKVTSIEFIKDGRHLLTASGVVGLGGVAALWDVETGELVREFKGHRDILYDATLSPSGSVLATCSYDRKIILWDVNSGEQLRTLGGHNGAIYDVAFDPNGRFLVSASADDTCKVWRVEDGVRLDTLGQPLNEEYGCGFGADGETVFAAGADKKIRIWKFISTDKPRINPQTIARFGHEGPITHLEMTPDGQRLISASEDKTIKLWDAASVRELHVWRDADRDVVSSLAVTPNGRSFIVGRMDGQIDRYEIPEVAPPKSRRSTAETDYVRITGEATDVAEQEPNATAATAQAVTVPAVISGLIHNDSESAVDTDLYRFTAKAGQQWVLEIEAARNKSTLDSFIEVLTSDGERLPRVKLQAVRESYFTFRGKDADQAGDFRLFNWQEMKLGQLLFASGEVAMLRSHPRGPDSGFEMEPEFGKRWGYFDTTPLAHALGEPAYVVEPHAPEAEIIPNGLPVFTIHYENDDAARRDIGKDSRLFFTAPADGEYIAAVRDVRGIDDPKAHYKLHIRPRNPRFEVWVDKKESLAIRSGSGREFVVRAKRIDGYDGPIRVDVDTLPDGLTATSPVVIEAGRTEAFGLIAASGAAATIPVIAPKPGDKSRDVVVGTATAMIRGEEVTRNFGIAPSIKIDSKPGLKITIEPLPGGTPPVSSASDGLLAFEIRPGETIHLNVRAERNGFKGRIPLGKGDAGRNLAKGVIVDNIGLNGLMIVGGTSERDFFITADETAQPGSRLFHLKSEVGGDPVSQPVMLHVLPPNDRLASRDR